MYTNEFAKEKAKKERMRVVVVIIIVLSIFLAVNYVGNRTFYERETYLTEKALASGGCAFSSCPDSWTEGEEYLGDYKRYSKKWWNIFCTNMMDTLFECNQK